MLARGGVRRRTLARLPAGLQISYDAASQADVKGLFAFRFRLPEGLVRLFETQAQGILYGLSHDLKSRICSRILTGIRHGGKWPLATDRSEIRQPSERSDCASAQFPPLFSRFHIRLWRPVGRDSGTLQFPDKFPLPATKIVKWNVHNSRAI